MAITSADDCVQEGRIPSLYTTWLSPVGGKGEIRALPQGKGIEGEEGERWPAKKCFWVVFARGGEEMERGMTFSFTSPPPSPGKPLT